jgi:predicted dehydrogenase
MKQISVALVGLGFGGAFAPIFFRHPDVSHFAIFDPNQDLAEKVSKNLGGVKTYRGFEDILKDPSVDAVHLVSPIPLHVSQTLAVLNAGKHCACTVPMATSIRDIEVIQEAVVKTGKNYCMMETAAYTTNFLKAKEMLDNGEFGRLQFLRGAHYQDMEYWPDYWKGLPPMWYGTHAITPLVLLAGSPIVRVRGLGSGTMRKELHAQYGNPFPIETMQIEFANGLKGEVTRSLFETAHDYTEQFSVYGSKKSFEWQQLEHEDPVVRTLKSGPNYDDNGIPQRGIRAILERIDPGNYYERLPEPIQRFTTRSGEFDENNPQVLSDKEAGGHGGSHPHLVHEFVRSVIEGRKFPINERNGGNVVAAGILAHESAMKDGAVLDVPVF